MHAPVIVETLDPVDDVKLGACAGVVAKQVGALHLQRLEEALHRRVDAPMSSKPRRVRQVSENQRIQGPDDVALQASVNFLV